MPLLYLDASAVVAAFVREPATERIQDFLQEQGAEQLAISGWVLTEVSSALALKMRTGAIEADLFASAHDRVRLFASGVMKLGIVETDFERAAALCRRPDLGLRAGDALHLAVAVAHGCALATLDKRLSAAAPEVGVPVAEV